MSKWIKVSDRHPKEEMLCWVCDAQNDIFDLFYSLKCADYNGEKIKYVPGFTRPDGDLSGDLFEPNDACEITHWMPYYTPEPPMSDEEEAEYNERVKELEVREKIIEARIKFMDEESRKIREQFNAQRN